MYDVSPFDINASHDLQCAHVVKCTEQFVDNDMHDDNVTCTGLNVDSALYHDKEYIDSTCTTNDSISMVSDDNHRIDGVQSQGRDSSEMSKFLGNFPLNVDHLEMSQKQCLYDTLFTNKDIFVTEDNPSLGHTTLVEHHIRLKSNAKSCHQRAHRLSPEKKDILRYQLDELLKQGIIAPVSDSEDVPITSPMLLVSKVRHKSKTGSAERKNAQQEALHSYRFCCDFRYLNSQMEEFRYTLPDLEDLTESFSSSVPNFLTSIDLSSGFFQMGISPDSTKYTAFNTCFGTYKFLRLPMGLRTSPNTFQLLMDKVLRGLTFQAVLCYLDDVLCISETFDEHMKVLDEIFKRFKAAGLKLNPKKCKFAQSEVCYLGHSISSKGISPPKDRVEAIQSFSRPHNIKALRRFLGMVGWFRKFIPNFGVVAEPLYYLLRKDVPFIWGNTQQSAFEKLKTLLCDSPILAFPRYDLQFRLAVDTCSKGIGYMLYQYHPSENGEHILRVIRFGSKSLSKWQKSYGPTKLELLGMTTAIMDCAAYLRCNFFVVECDHQALQPLFRKKLKGAIYERWLTLLQQFNFDIVYKPASQMVVVDALSREPISANDGKPFESPDEIDPYFPDIPEMKGNIRLPSGQPLMQALRSTDSDSEVVRETNFIQVLPTSLPRSHVVDLKGFESDDGYDGDSEDEISLLKRENDLPRKGLTAKPSVCSGIDLHGIEPKDGTILECSRNSEPVEPIQTTLTPDKHPHNQYNFDQSQDDDIGGENRDSVFDRETEVDSVDNLPAYTCTTDMNTPTGDEAPSAEENMSSTSDIFAHIDQILGKGNVSITSLKELQHMDIRLKPLLTYLQEDKLPSEQKLARQIILESSDYIIIDELLFHSRVSKTKRASTLSAYQFVLPESLHLSVVKFCHESTLGSHGGIQDTIDKMKDRFFFKGMASYIANFVRSCEQCQSRKVTKRHTQEGIKAFPTPSLPFQVWEADLYGPLPTSYRGNTYIFTAVDLYSKFLVATPLANKDAMSVATALFDLFTSYGVCETLITDCGTEFTAQVTEKVCELLRLEKQFTPPYTHHCLGACERTHRTLAERLTPLVKEDERTWDTFLQGTVFSMNTTVNSSSGFSPFEVIYGHRPRFPLLSADVNLDAVPGDHHVFVATMCKRLEHIRTEMEEHVANSKQRMEDRVNSKSNPLQVKAGDYVYLLHGGNSLGRKLHDRYQGPLVVQELCSDHTVKLRNPKTGQISDSVIHMNRLKMAFVREPHPSPYFLGNVSSKTTIKHVDAQTQVLTEEFTSTTGLGVDCNQSDRDTAVRVEVPRMLNERPSPELIPLRPKRNIRKPLRYQSSSAEISTDSASPFYKIKKIIGQRLCGGQKEYLVQFSGEPTQNAMWVAYEDLNAKCQGLVRSKPPPVLN
ncbi:hypothetical protein FSP39_020404 [Pinctada imbricata]|uniref:Uncharacterized protein n=1 Tax=Pinctada imbricata TaxID=66713 RepID=A0AA88YJK5_PINIB|nr:hypothetical protein FSP39_020404 [Pinctada imbricata]